MLSNLFLFSLPKTKVLFSNQPLLTLLNQSFSHTGVNLLVGSTFANLHKDIANAQKPLADIGSNPMLSEPSTNTAAATNTGPAEEVVLSE